MENTTIIHFRMPSFDLDGRKVMQEFEHGVKKSYFEDKQSKMKLTDEQIAKWIIKQAYKVKEVEILKISVR